MITEICLYLKNWFDENQGKFYGRFKIEDGHIVSLNDGDMGIQTGQYFRIIGSVFNDGVWQTSDSLIDESFEGAVWLMAVPNDVKALASEIEEWQNKYGVVSSVNMSPFQSESFNQYSYSKGSAGASSASTVPTWQSVYADRLRRYKKI